MTASRNARALAHITSYFQAEKVHLDAVVRSLALTVHRDEAAASGPPLKTLILDSADQVWRIRVGGVVPVGVDAIVSGFDGVPRPGRPRPGPLTTFMEGRTTPRPG